MKIDVEGNSDDFGGNSTHMDRYPTRGRSRSGVAPNTLSGGISRDRENTNSAIELLTQLAPAEAQLNTPQAPQPLSKL